MSTTAKQDEKAYRLLEYPEEYPGLLVRREVDRKLLLFRYPSFEINTSWSLFKTDKAFWIRRIEWDRSKWFPSEDAEPFTFGCEISCSSDFAENILSSLSSIEFCPLQQPTLYGIDGTIHGIKTGNHWLSCTLRWWYLPADDWKPLAQWFETTVKMFEQVLPESTCRSI
jgi:hypothetical protein